ncbi:hypothetical protein JXB27_03410, partial [Candidatus Woesearchaeota archaeon]|nr:hypothetical protein [Candidatus Woesearchaeota archaeon]
GLEKYAASEIEELLKVKTKTEDSVVLFECTKEKLAYLCYKSQSLIKVCSLIEKIELNSVSDLKKIKTDFKKIIPKNKTFRVKFARMNSDFVSQEIEPALADAMFEESSREVDLENPDYVVYCYVCGNNAYIGIDYAGFDLGKRDYRIFANPKSLHANISYILLRIAGFEVGKSLIDPFCMSGETGIEAALYLSGKSPYHFSKNKFAFSKFMKFNFDNVDKKAKSKIKGRIVLSSPKMSDVRAAQKNAKIAGVEKMIEFTRQDVEWLDLKINKGAIDCLVSHIPCPSTNLTEKDLKRDYDDLFFQIKHVLSKKGKAVVMGKNLSYLKSLAKDVKLKEEIKFFNGKEPMEIAVFEKE